MEEFYVIHDDYNNEGKCIKSEWIKVMAEPIEKYGVKMFMTNNKKDYYYLYVKENGCLITSGMTKSCCMDNLKRFVEENGKEEFLKLIARVTEKVAKDAGRNPLCKSV
jgi:hypothetical protein